jgi:hypothetical protein
MTKTALPIPDPNLHIALLSALIDAKLSPRLDLPALRREHPPEIDPDDLANYDDGEDAPDSEAVLEVAGDYTFNDNLAHLLLQIPITAEQLAGLHELYGPRDYIGDAALATYLQPQWDGEDELFDIHDLTGLEHCTALREIILGGGEKLRSLAPLSKLTELRKLKVWGKFTSLEPLGGLSKLEELDIGGDMTTLGGLAGLPELRVLRARGPIESLATLPKLPKLTTLELDQVEARDLSPLLECPRLREVSLRWNGWRVTDPDLHRIWKTNATCIKALEARRSLKLEIEAPKKTEPKPAPPPAPPPPPAYRRNAKLEAAIERAYGSFEEVAAYLAYGSWLREQNDPRGRLVDLLSPVNDDRKKAKEGKAYIEGNKALLLGPLAEKANVDAIDVELEWQWGFVDNMEVTLTDESKLITEILAVPTFRFLKKLTVFLAVNGPGSAAKNTRILEAIASVDPAPSIRKLLFGRYTPEEDAPMTATFGDGSSLWPRLPLLEELSINGAMELGTLVLPKLRELYLRSDQYIESLRTLRRPELPKLETLWVGNPSADPTRPPSTIDELRRALDGLALPKLESLGITGYPDIDELLDWLVAWPPFKKVRYLHIDHASFRASALRRLADRRFGKLKGLDLRESTFEDEELLEPLRKQIGPGFILKDEDA